MREIQSISGSSQGCNSHSARKDISRRDPGYYVSCHRRETCCRSSCRHSTDVKAMYMLMLTRRGTGRRLPTRLWWHHRNRKPPTTNASRKSIPHPRPNDPAYHNRILAIVKSLTEEPPGHQRQLLHHPVNDARDVGSHIYCTGW